MVELTILTLMNDAFSILARNLVESMRRAGCDGEVIIGTPRGHSADLPRGCVRMESDFCGPKSLYGWLTGNGYMALCLVKLDLIRKLLEKCKEAFCCDADASWRKNIIPLSTRGDRDASFTCGNSPFGIYAGLARIRPMVASRRIFEKVGIAFVDDETHVFNGTRWEIGPTFPIEGFHSTSFRTSFADRAASDASKRCRK